MLLLNIAYNNWSKMWKRNQSIFHGIMSNTSMFSRGIYINSPMYYGSKLDIHGRINSIKNNYNSDKYGNNIDILTPHVWLPFTFKFPISNFFVKHYVDIIEKYFIKDSKYVLWINNPCDNKMYDISIKLSEKAKYIVFDMSDDFEAFDNKYCDKLNKNIKNILNISDVFIGVNEKVVNKYHHKNKIEFCNSTNYNNFQNIEFTRLKLPPIIPKCYDQKYIGFIGGFNEGRIDEKLMIEVLKRFNQCKIVVVGHTNCERMLKQFLKYSNFYYFESVDYEDLPIVIKSFDVAIVPHLDNEHTRGNDLLKILDYMATGVPIVTTNCSNVDNFSDCLYISNTNIEFLDNIEYAITRNNNDRISRGKEYAKIRSWEETVPKLINKIIIRGCRTRGS